MSERRRRTANRVFFDARATLRARKGSVDAHIEDISWTGVRLRVRRLDLKIPAQAGIGAAASSVELEFGARFEVRLDSGASGAGVTKLVEVVRLALPDDKPNVVDLGCTFVEALGERETEALGLSMPKDLRRAQTVRRVVPTQEPSPRIDPDVLERELPDAPEAAARESSDFQPAEPLRAVLSNPGNGGAEPVLCHTETFTKDTVIVRARAEMPPFNCRWQRRSIAEAAVNFTEVYGERLRLELVHGARRVWEGPVRVCAIEVDPEFGRDILLCLGFGRPLLEAEVKRIRTAGATDAA